MLIRTRLWPLPNDQPLFFPKIIYKSLFKNMYRIENLELYDYKIKIYQYLMFKEKNIFGFELLPL